MGGVMDVDMSKFEGFEVIGKEREEVMKRIAKQVNDWGLRLPDSPYLMFHFGLKNFYNVGETEFWVANEIEAGYCAKLIFVFDGQTCPYHEHRLKHETFFIIKGKVKMVVDDKEMVVSEGKTRTISVGTKHSFTGAGNCLLLEVSMPSVPGDSYFENKKIGTDGIL